MGTIAELDFADKLGEVIKRTIPKVGPDVGEQLRQMTSKTSLAVMAGVVVAWVASHGIGIGEAIDVIIGVLGALAIGLAVFSGLDELYEFAVGTYRASSERDLEGAATHFAKAISILGVTAVLAVLFRGRPRTSRRPVDPATAPTNPGRSYQPTTSHQPLRRGVLGETDKWGNIRISTLGTAQQQEIALLHEAVHRFLTPKFFLLRNFRVANREGSYFGSALWRYIEEALAQTIALVGRVGWARAFEGLSFPVKNGYMFLVRSGGHSAGMGGKGLSIEGAGLVASGEVVGMRFELWFKRQAGRMPAFGHTQ